MPKRSSDEEKVVNFFNQADFSKAQTVFNICRGIMKSRAEGQLPTGTAGTAGTSLPKSRKARVKKSKAVGAIGSAATSFPGADVDTGNAA